MDNIDPDKSVIYVAHALALKEKSSIRKELVKQPKVGHIAIFPMEKVLNHKGLWLYPIEEIPQRGRKTRLLYNFPWSNLNAKLNQAASKEAMQL